MFLSILNTKTNIILFNSQNNYFFLFMDKKNLSFLQVQKKFKDIFFIQNTLKNTGKYNKNQPFFGAKKFKIFDQVLKILKFSHKTSLYAIFQHVLGLDFMDSCLLQAMPH